MTAAAPALPVRQKNDYVAVLVAFASFVVIGLPGSLLGIAWASDEWPSIQKFFGLGIEAVGALSLTFTIGYFTASFISGRLFARFSTAMIFTGGTLISAVGLAGYILVPSWVVIVGCGLLVGFGGGLLDAGMNIYFAAIYGPRLMNWLHACFGIGATLGALVMTVIFQNGGSWQNGYMVVLALYAIQAGLFFVTRGRWQKVGGSGEANVSAPAARTLRLPIVWIGILVFVFYAGLEAVPIQWLSPLFNQARGIEAGVAGTWVSIFLASFTAGRIFFGMIVTRITPVTLIRLCIVVMLITAGALALNLLPESAVIWAAVYGFAVSPIFALVVTNTQERLGPVHGANAIGFYVASASLGFGVLPGIAGVLAGQSSLEIVPKLMLGLLVVMAVMYEVMMSRRLQKHLIPTTD